MLQTLKIYRVLKTVIREIHQKTDLQTLTKPTGHTEKFVPSIELVENHSLEEAIKEFDKEKAPSVLEESKEDISHIAPYIRPSFNFAAYVNKSETLQELLKLGVDLHKIEKKKDAPSFVTSLNFEKDIKGHVLFLYDLGLSIADIGKFITINPFIFREDLDNLKTRITYLKFKKFDDENIKRIVTLNPMWLQFSTQEIDDKLGFLQKKFHLTGDEVRKVAVKQPKIVTYNENSIKVNLFAMKEEMGFNDHEMKIILIQTPRMFMKRHENIQKSFQYLQKKMGISHSEIMKFPQILTYRENKLKERFMFLQKLNRVQFDPKKPNYVSLISLVSHSDAHFAVEIAKSSIQVYNEFLKTL